MTILQDPRVIDFGSEHYNAELVRREDDTEELATFWVRFRGEPVSFEPGQYMTIGVYADGRLVQRPYSVASSPRTARDGYEFYVRLVPVLRFTSLLWRLPLGHGVRMTGPKGRFVLEDDDPRTHLVISTGTGIAPFISMIRTALLDKRPRRTVIAHGASYVEELGYRRELEQLQREGYPLTYVPTISRPAEPENAGWQSRTGRVETILNDFCDECSILPYRMVVYICGNPEMILKAEAIVRSHGLPEPHVKKELHWPKGKGAGQPVDVTTGERAHGRAAEVASQA